jgi:hypothetical protein
MCIQMERNEKRDVTINVAEKLKKPKENFSE